MRSLSAVVVLCVVLGSSGALFAQMSINSITPNEVSYLGQTEFTITGSDLPSVFVGVEVLIDGNSAQVLSHNTSTITGIYPSHAPTASTVDVSVLDLQTGAMATLADAVAYVGPLAVDAAFPRSIPEFTAGQIVTINGLGFTPNSNVRLILPGGGGMPVDTIYVDTFTLQIAPPPLGVGSYGVIVEAPTAAGLVTATLNDAFMVTGDLVLESFEPNEVSYLGGTPFTLYGAGFTSETQVTIAGETVDAQFVDANTMVGSVPASSDPEFGLPIPVTATNPGGPTESLSDAFVYVGMFEVTFVSPDFVVVGLTPPLTALGSAFTASTQIEIGGLPADTSFVSHNELNVQLPAGLAPGVHNLRAFHGPSENPIAESELLAAITIAGDAQPNITSIEPDVACADGGTFVTITGTDFLPETDVEVFGSSLQDKAVSPDGTTISGIVPAAPVGVPASGPVLVTVQDFRGGNESDQWLAYTDQCATLRAPEQIEGSLAYGTARFCWYNPEQYTAIQVLNEVGQVIDTIPGDATEYMTTAGGGSSVSLQFVGVHDTSLSDAAAGLAQVYPCSYPPPIGGAVVPGELDLAIRGNHAPANVTRCSDGDGPQGPFATVPYSQPSGSVGYMQPQWVVAQQQSLGLSTVGGGNTLKTGFTLENDADRLEISGYYQKVAGDFGLSLRGRLVHVFPDDGFTDEFTFPDPKIGAAKSLQTVTYFRATEDIGSPSAEVCVDGNGAPKPIPAGEYILEIYAVGGNSSTPYYVFADDPRDQQIFIEGVPCPPYPLVQVRDMTGLRTLPDVKSIEVMSATENPNGTVDVTLSARGTWFDEDNNQWSIDPYCDFKLLVGTFGGTPSVVCIDPPFNLPSHIEFCWSIQVFEPAMCKIDGSVSTHTMPEWGCYGIDLTVRDKACGVERTTFDEVALIPDNTTCTPGNNYFSFLFPTPNPNGVCAIANLNNPSPGNGTFGGKRPFAARVLVTPKCYCDGGTNCAGAFVFEDTAQTPPGAPSDLSDPGDDVQFRLAVKRYIPISPFVEYYDLNAEVRVTDLCPDVADGPKYFYVYVDDLGEIPWSPQLDDQIFREVYLQGKTNCTRVFDGSGTVCTPVPPSAQNQWWNIGGPMKMANHPQALDVAYWRGYFDEQDCTYHFSVNSSGNPEEPFALDDTQALEFGIVDAGIPEYSGNVVSTGFTSRIACQAGNWYSEDGSGSSSGSLLENELATAPQVVGGSEITSAGYLGGGGAPAYEWCDHTDIFDHSMSQELFRSIIYAGFIGPIPVNIWGSVGLGIKIAIDSYLEFRVSPFEQLPTGNYVEMQYTLTSDVGISIPCQIGADILGGIASVVLRLRPEVNFEFDPYIIAGLGASPNFVLDYYLRATFELIMEAEACIQTLIFGEQCLPPISIPLIPETDILPQHGSDPTPESCSGGSVTSFPSGASPAGGITISSYEIANAPVSVTSPDGTVVIDAWVSEDTQGKLLKVCITEQGQSPIVIDSGLPGIGWYFLDPQAAFVNNELALFVGTGPPMAFDAETPPMDIADPDYLDIRNANVAYTEIQMASIVKDPMVGWSVSFQNLPRISDPDAAPTVDRRADGRASISGDQVSEEALVAWVRYTGDYLIQDGFLDFLLPTGGCANSLCLALLQPNIRPQMEATSIVVRRVDADGVIPGQEITTISEPGINVQPSISVAPSSNTAYCAWVHDATHVDLLTTNQGRELKYSVYDKATDTWSPPMNVLSNPAGYPGLLEPYMVLKDDLNGMLAFTALPSWAEPDDSGLGGGSRLLYACRLENGVFGEPVLLRGRCTPRQYGWGQSLFFDLPDLLNILDLYLEPPEWVMGFQEFGEVGLPEGSGNVMISVINEGSNDWTPAQPLMPQGSVITNVATTGFDGGLHSVHFDAGPSELGAVLLGPPQTGYQIHDTPLQPDAAITHCQLFDPMAGPGVSVRGVVDVENFGFVGTPFDVNGDSAIGLQIVFVDNDGTETVMQEEPLEVLRAGEKTQVEIEVEMPHDPVRLQVRLYPNPIDRDHSNDMRECFFGAPKPQNLGCTIKEFVFEDGSSELSVRLEWDNPAVYEKVLLYRDGSMIHALGGGCQSFTDTNVGLGYHTYEVRGVIGASKSCKAYAECLVEPPLPEVGFLRGDTNADGTVNIADAVYALDYLFNGGETPSCFASADINFDATVNIADAVFLLGYLFQSGEAPPAPFPDCGPSSAASDLELSCENEGC